MSTKNDWKRRENLRRKKQNLNIQNIWTLMKSLGDGQERGFKRYNTITKVVQLGKIATQNNWITQRYMSKWVGDVGVKNQVTQMIVLVKIWKFVMVLLEN